MPPPPAQHPPVHTLSRPYARPNSVAWLATSPADAAAADGDGDGGDDPLLALADLVALFKLAGERADEDRAPPPDVPAWIDRLAGEHLAAARGDAAGAARSRAALARAAQITRRAAEA